MLNRSWGWGLPPARHRTGAQGDREDGDAAVKRGFFLLNSPRSVLPGEGTEAENTTAFLKALDGAGRLSRIRVN